MQTIVHHFHAPVQSMTFVGSTMIAIGLQDGTIEIRDRILSNVIHTLLVAQPIYWQTFRSKISFVNFFKSQKNKFVKKISVKNQTFHHTVKSKTAKVFKSEALQPILAKISLDMSKVAHETCLFLNAYFLWVCEKDKAMHPIKDVQSIFKNAMRLVTIGKLDKRADPYQMMIFFTNHYKNVLGRPLFDFKTLPGSHFFENVAKEMETNMLNHFTFPLEKRLKAFCRSRTFTDVEKDKKHAYDMTMSIFRGIDNWKGTLPRKREEKEVLRVWTQEEIDFIHLCRSWMGLKDQDQWGEKYFQKNENAHHAIYFHYKMLQALEVYQNGLDEDAKKTDSVRLFTLIPQRKIRHAHIQVSTTNVKTELFMQYKELQPEKPKAGASDQEYWDALIDTSKLANKKWTLESMRTDGTNISVLFTQTKQVSTVVKTRTVENQFDLTQRLQTKRSFIDGEYKVPAIKQGDIEIIGIDPGRTDLMYAHNLSTGQEMHLSKKQYYQESFMTKNGKWWQRYRDRTKVDNKDQPGQKITLGEVMSTLPTFKTSSYTLYMERLPKYWKYEKELWQALCVSQRNNHKFTTYVHKNKCIDQFFQRVIKPTLDRGKIPIFSFGAAKFATSSKGEISGPLKSLVQRAELHCNTVMMNEYKTSQLCAEDLIDPVTNLKMGKCHCQLDHPTRHRFEWKKKDLVKTNRPIHNLVWCTTNHKHKFMNRDSNASRNIGFLLQSILFGSKTRPAAFCPPVTSPINKILKRKASAVDDKSVASLGNKVPDVRFTLVGGHSPINVPESGSQYIGSH